MAGGLALALSGGGARGAFQVGVLDEIITRRGVDFDHVVGTSTGAIQGAAVVQGDVDRLLDFWLGIEGNHSIYKGRGGTIWPIITGKDSLYNPAPLKALLEEMYDDERIRNSGKDLRIATVDIVSGELRIITEAETSYSFADWVYASCAQPPFLPPFDTTGPGGKRQRWVDGGVKDVTPYGEALKLKPRAVLVVRAEAPYKTARTSFDSVIDIGLESVETLSHEVAAGDLANVDLINQLLEAEMQQRSHLASIGLTPPQVEAAMKPVTDALDRFCFAPTLVLQPPTDDYERLEFDPGKIGCNIARGRKMAQDRWSEIAAFLGVPE